MSCAVYYTQGIITKELSQFKRSEEDTFKKIVCARGTTLNMIMLSVSSIAFLNIVNDKKFFMFKSNKKLNGMLIDLK